MTYDAAYQGAPGAYGEEAALAVAGAAARLLACERFDEVFDAVDLGAARLGVVPVENALVGPILPVLALLAGRDVEVAGETSVRVSHALVGAPGASLASVRRVRSHPVALAQCKAFFRANPHVASVVDFDTAGAVERVVRSGAPDEAAIASRRAASLYGGVVLAEELQDAPDNFTRFVAFQRPR